MIENGTGGGNTTTGLKFEGRVDLSKAINLSEEYSVDDDGAMYLENTQI